MDSMSCCCEPRSLQMQHAIGRGHCSEGVNEGHWSREG